MMAAGFCGNVADFIMRRRDLIVLGCLLLVAPASLFPQQGPVELIPRSFEELVAGSDRIVVGTCLQAVAGWDHGLIMTKVSLAVDDNLKGAASNIVEFTIPGGEVDGIRMEAGQMPTARRGERMVVFLSHNDLGGMLVFGAIQGKFDVIKDPADGTLVVTNPLVKVTTPSTAITLPSRTIVEEGKRMPAVTLSDAARSIRAWVAQKKGSR